MNVKLVDGQGLTCGRSYLHRHRLGLIACTLSQRLDSVVIGCGCDAVDLVGQLADFLLDRILGYGVIGSVSGLGCQGCHTLQHAVNFGESTFLGLDESDGVLRVGGCLIETVDLLAHLLGNCEACCIICCAVDTITG